MHWALKVLSHRAIKHKRPPRFGTLQHNRTLQKRFIADPSESYRIQRSEGKVATQDTGVNLAGPVHPSKISYPGVGRWAHNYVLCQGFFVNTTVCCSKTSNWSYQYPLVSTKHPHPATQLFEDQCILEPPQLWACNQAICGGISGFSFENANNLRWTQVVSSGSTFQRLLGQRNFDFAQISHREGRRRVLRHRMTFPAVRNYYVNAKSSVHESEMIINPLFPSSNFNKQSS